MDLFPEVTMAKKRQVARRKVGKGPAKRTAKRRSKKRAAARKVAKRTARRATRSRTRGATRRKPSAAFMKPMQPDAALAAVVGEKPMPRTEITKKLWAYIKRRGLQDKKNRRMINADDNLRAVFNGKRQVSMFEMTKLVNRHLK
jgi:chromatin remodeling complex protein RSC6